MDIKEIRKEKEVAEGKILDIIANFLTKTEVNIQGVGANVSSLDFVGYKGKQILNSINIEISI